jgi:hypothetical protein
VDDRQVHEAAERLVAEFETEIAAMHPKDVSSNTD